MEDSVWSRYSKASVNYGVANNLTVGGGIEYLFVSFNRASDALSNASFRVTRNLLLTGEYTYGVRAKGLLAYRLPSNIQLDLNYTKYTEGQKAIRYNYLEERRAALSLPLRFGNFSAYSRVSYSKIVVPFSYYTNAEWMLAGQIFGVHANLTNYAIFISEVDPNYFSTLFADREVALQFCVNTSGTVQLL